MGTCWIFNCQCVWTWVLTIKSTLCWVMGFHDGDIICISCVCAGGAVMGSTYLAVYRQLPDIRLLRFNLHHSCDPREVCHRRLGNHLDPCHWCGCSVNMGKWAWDREQDREWEKSNMRAGGGWRGKMWSQRDSEWQDESKFFMWFNH